MVDTLTDNVPIKMEIKDDMEEANMKTHCLRYPKKRKHKNTNNSYSVRSNNTSNIPFYDINHVKEEVSHNEMDVEPKLEMMEEVFIITELEEEPAQDIADFTGDYPVMQSNSAAVKTASARSRKEPRTKRNGRDTVEYSSILYEDHIVGNSSFPEEADHALHDASDEIPASNANSRLYPCSICSKIFMTNSKLKMHMCVHTGDKPYVCDICDKCFGTNANLSSHKKSHLGEDSKSYKKLMRNVDRMAHMRSHTGEKQFKCELCYRGYTSKMHVWAHMQRDHKTGNGECVEELQIQLNSDKNIKPTDGNDRCSRKSKKLQNSVPDASIGLIATKNSNSEVLVQKMSTSIEKTKSLSSENEVIDVSAPEGAPGKKRHRFRRTNFQCTVCLKAFARNSALKIHSRIHTGEKPYTCDICQKSFRANANLNFHKKSHMGETYKNYKCDHCDKKFIRNIDRKAHMRTHTGERPFKCKICNYGYSSNMYVWAHMKRDHDIPVNDTRPYKEPEPDPSTLKQFTERENKLKMALRQKLKQKMKSYEFILPIDQPTNDSSYDDEGIVEHKYLVDSSTTEVDKTATIKQEKLDNLHLPLNAVVSPTASIVKEERMITSYYVPEI